MASPVNLRKPGPGETPPIRPAETVEARGSEIREWTDGDIQSRIVELGQQPAGRSGSGVLAGQHPAGQRR